MAPGATKPASPRYSRRTADERSREILDEACRRFRERPYADVSTAEIAEAVGVTPGLVHHYFGTKRELYLEVVRRMVRVPTPPDPGALDGRELHEVVASSVEAWLDLVARHHQTWFSTISGDGFGRDPEIVKILDEAHEAAAERTLMMLGVNRRNAADPELRAVIRSFAAMAEEATHEWLVRGRLERAQVRELLGGTLIAIVLEVVPRMRNAARDSVSR